jgi:YggT family protein
MDSVLKALLVVAYYAVDLYYWAVIISAVLSWLVAFDVINVRNKLMYSVIDVLYRITEPALRPIRRFLPNTGGLDFSPLVLIFALMFVRMILQDLIFKVSYTGIG